MISAGSCAHVVPSGLCVVFRMSQDAYLNVCAWFWLQGVLEVLIVGLIWQVAS